MTLEMRTAIEALRAGVPNRAAIRQMGTEQTAIEYAFETVLASAWSNDGKACAGIGLTGDFGAGKSHMLGYLAEVARQQGFVVSRVVVSKETPLSHPGHVLATALRNAALPDRPDDPVAACVAVLRQQPDALDGLDAAVDSSEAGFPPIFAACLFLLRRASTTPETLRRIARFWSGARVSVPAIRQALAAVGAGKMFQFKPVPAAELTTHLIRFVPLLFRNAGYGGWCILFDEVELIGRYTSLQRATAYAWLANWLGLPETRRVPGIVSAYAITEDFVTLVISGRQDKEKLHERLILKGRSAEAAWALAGIAHIERMVQQHRLVPPTSQDLTTCHDKVQMLYRDAYVWSPPALASAERTSSRTMRQYIKGWITQWDLLRLEGSAVSVVADGIASNYTEDASLDRPPELDGEET